MELERVESEQAGAEAEERTWAGAEAQAEASAEEQADGIPLFPSVLRQAPYSFLCEYKPRG